MYEDPAPIGQQARLTPYSPDYRSVVDEPKAPCFFSHAPRANGRCALQVALPRLSTFNSRKKTARIEDFENIAERHRAGRVKSGQDPPNLRHFRSVLNSTGVPDFTIEYVVYRTPKGFRTVGKIKQPLDTFRMPVDLRIDTEGNPEQKTVDVIGTESASLSKLLAGRNRVVSDRFPNNVILKGSTGCLLRRHCAWRRSRPNKAALPMRGAISARALHSARSRWQISDGRRSSSTRKNYQASANAFREALQTVPEPSEKWTECWSHIYLGKIFDLLGSASAASNEYSKANKPTTIRRLANQIRALGQKALLRRRTSVAAPAATTPAKPAANIPPPASAKNPYSKARPSPQ